MSETAQADKPNKIKDRLIWLWASAGFLLPFLVFLFLRSSQLGEQSYHNPWTHSLLLLIVCGVALYTAYIAYREYKENQAVNLFITSLAFYTFGFVFFLHSIAIPDFGLFTEDLFEVAEHYGLFLGSLILLGMILPLEGIRGFLYQQRVKFFWGWAIFLLTAFIVLVLFPPLAEILAGAADFITGLTIPLITITLLFMLFSYQRSRNGLLVYFIIALAILINSAIIPFFYEEWNLLWWYFHFTFLLPFLIILLGLLRYRHAEREIIKAFAKTRSKLLVIFLLVGIFPLGIFGFLNIQNFKTDLRTEIEYKMMLFAEAKEGQIFAYFDALETRTLDFASDGFIIESLKKINETGSDQAVEDLNTHLVMNKQELDPSIAGILIINLKGKVVAATDNEEIGEDESDDEYFIPSQKGIFMMEVTEEKGHFGLTNPIAVGAPLKDHQGELLGVIINIFKTDKLYKILSGEFQMQKGAMSNEQDKLRTMEVYLVDKEKRMMSSSAIIVDTLPVRKCLEEQKETSAEYFNYEQIEVLGASMCIASRGWTMVVEITAEEAFMPIEKMQQRLILTILLFVALTSGSALVFSKTISNPIKKLHEAAEIITEGNLDYRVDIKTGDEIEQLAGAFNQMTVKLKSSYSELEKKVEEKTKDLSEKIDELQKFKEVTIGRELKMIELKEVLRQTQNELAKRKGVKN